MFRSILLLTILINSNKWITSSESSCVQENHEHSEQPVLIDDNKSDEKIFRYDPVEIGFKREVEIEPGVFRTLVTQSVTPPVFTIQDVLTDEELQHIKNKANETGLFTSALHLDEKTILSRNYSASYGLTIASSFEVWDTDNDGFIKIPQEIKSFAERYHFLYFDNDDVSNLLHKFNFRLTIVDDKTYVSYRDFVDLNHKGISDYLVDVRTNDPRHRDRYSEQTWISMNDPEDKIIQSVKRKVRALTRLSDDIIDGSEPIQVVRYTKYGHYHAHFDSQERKQYPDFECCHLTVGGTPGSCRICRYMTVFHYLNDVKEGGETAFPVANIQNFNHSEFMQRRRGDLYNLSKFCKTANLVVKPKKGLTVMWYNHFTSEDGMYLGPLDENSLHGGCDVIEGEKWIANNWIPIPEFENKHKISIFSSRFERQSAKSHEEL